MLFGTLAGSSAFAQFQGGGVDHPGTWYAGEGLKQGDFFSYSMCHVDYKECTNFELDMWIKGDKQVGSETKWLAEVVVFDGSKIIVGEMELGKIAPEPTGGSEELGLYRGAFKSSIAWLSAFATSDDRSGGKGPKAFSAISWGKIGNIGGEQIAPIAIENVTVPAGSWETIQIGWKTGGVVSKIWIVDDFPFPIKAKTYTHVSEGIAPVEYEFALLNYKENVQESPIAQYTSTKTSFVDAGCETNFDKEVKIKKPTKNFDYQLHIFYGPEDLVQGCETKWIIKFISKYDDTEFLNQVQYDFLVVDDDFSTLRSLAKEDNKNRLYSPSGQAIIDFIVKEKPGTVKYAILIYGLSPEGITPVVPWDYLVIPATIFANDSIVVPPVPAAAVPQEIPSWIKDNAGWWADGILDDATFVRGIQFLIEKDIIKIPSTTAGSSDGTTTTTTTSSEIPPWIKANAGWWADGSLDDATFIRGIQFLIENGIININS